MRAWVLNLDAEDELAAGPGYERPRAVAERILALAPRLGGLLAPGDIVLEPGAGGPAPEGARGLAWCPTPGAMRTFARRGVEPPEAPEAGVLVRVLDRRFSAFLGQLLPGATFALDLEAARARLRERPEASASGRWLVKRALGFAGRGRRVFEPGELPANAEAGAEGARWLAASFSSGRGVQIEPLVERLADHALHGYVARGGAITLGRPTLQRCDARGAWQESLLASHGELAPAELDALVGEARRAGEALREAGYFGPFGVDAYRFRDGRGRVHFLPRGEVNARYSMGWALGMGSERPDLAP